MELKDVLIQYRKENNLSQREFAKKCGLSNSLISILEMGENPQTGKKPSPSIETYKCLASGMGTTVHELFEKLGDSEMVNLKQGSDMTIIISSSEILGKLVTYMNSMDYKMFMEILERAEIRMREEENDRQRNF